MHHEGISFFEAAPNKIAGTLLTAYSHNGLNDLLSLSIDSGKCAPKDLCPAHTKWPAS